MSTKPSNRPTLDSITNKPKSLPTRTILHAVPKWGKTSFAAYAPAPVVLMTRGEDGLLALMSNALVPPTDHYPEELCDWAKLLHIVDDLAHGVHNYKTLVLDTLNGAERLAHEATCRADCGGDWTNFDAYGRGHKLSLARLITLTTKLDECRRRGVGILLLCHSQVKSFKNPTGPDYDRWEPVLARESWAHLDRWADMVLFGAFETELGDVAPRTKKTKARGGQQRLLYTERRAAWDAGNRLGLPEEIDCGSCAADAWANFRQSLKSVKGDQK